MIEYKCASCGAALETDDFQSGKRQTCPACGKVNLIPLSKRDQAAEQERQRQAAKQAAAEQERQRWAAERAAAEHERQRWEQERQRWEQAAAKQAAEDQVRPSRPSVTETVLGLLGGMYVTIGALLGVICIVAAAFPEKPVPLRDLLRFEANYPLVVVGGIIMTTGLLWGMLCFIVQQVLQYLRRITNAIEGRK